MDRAQESIPQHTLPPQHQLVPDRAPVRVDVDENKALCNILTFSTLGIVKFFGVPQGNIRFVTLFGKSLRKVEPGLNRCISLWGLYQKISNPVPVMEQILEHKPDHVLTADSMAFRITAVVFYTIHDPVKAIFHVEHYQSAMTNLVDATLRNECGKLAARELPAAREKIAGQLRSQLDEGTGPWGITIRLVEITHMAKDEKNK